MDKKLINFLNSLPLFEGLRAQELAEVCGCFEIKPKKYKKGAVIAAAGKPLDYIGLVVKGSVNIYRIDINGQKSLTQTLGKGDLFAGAILAAGIEASPFMIEAAAEAEIINLNYAKLINPCSKHCAFHTVIIKNLLQIMAQKTLQLRARFEILSKRTIRERVLVYLQTDLMRKTPGAQAFKARAKLAQYLSVNRCALERELTQMQKENLIQIVNRQISLVKKGTYDN